MVGEWVETTIRDVVDIKHGFAFDGRYFRDEPPGDVLLTPRNFAVGGGFKRDKFKYYHGPVPDEFVLREGDLLVTMTDLSKGADTLGYPALVPAPERGRRYLHNQRLGRVVPKSDGAIELRYLHYLMCSDDYRHEVLAGATGTTVKHTSPTRIMRFRFLRPPLDEQRAIAEILGTLDDKIELNRRMSETLEATARAVFKSWFVDFDPVRAKVEGRDPGLPKHIAQLFPDRFEESELGEIPVGWGVVPFADTVEIVGGGTPKTSVAAYWNGNTPWFSVVDAPGDGRVWVVDTEKKITAAGVENSATRILPKGTTIISARGTVGRLALVGVPMAMNQSCYGLRGRNGGRGFFTYFATHTVVTELLQRTHGSVFDTITRDTLKSVMVVFPAMELVQAFEQHVAPLLERVLSSVFESRDLGALRDTLLPKLISGELRLKDPGRFHDVDTQTSPEASA